MAGSSRRDPLLLPGIKPEAAQTDESFVRIGVVLITAAVGVLAAAFAILPLALRHPQNASYPVAAKVISSFWAIPIDGGKPRLVARLKGQYDYPVPSADGRSLLVLKPTFLRGETAVWSLPLDGGSPRWVGRAPYYGLPSWSPDRKLFAAGDRGGDRRDIALYDLAGRPVRSITRLRGFGGASFPSWGGPNLAFIRETRPSTGVRLDLEVWRATGGLVWSMPLAFPNGSVTLSPDGRRLALLQVHRLQLLTQHSRRLLATGVQEMSVVWTPDGKRLLYLDQKRRLVVQDVASGSRRVLASGLIGEASVSPDGRTVYVSAFRGAKPAVSIPK
jgi:Tol biopolymer transport system component